MAGFAEPTSPSTFDRIGGTAGCYRLARAFYARVAQNERLMAIYPRHLRCPTDNLAEFLAHLTGGPSRYGNEARHPHMRARHAKFKIGRREREEWMKCMSAALDESVEDPAFRGELHGFFTESSRRLMNIEALDGRRITGEGPIIRNWNRAIAGEELVNAARAGEIETIRALAGDADAEMLDPNDLMPALAAAASAGQLDAMRALRALGADPRAVPLGSVVAGSLEGLTLLLEWGADVESGNRPPLVEACRGDRGEHPEKVELLLRFGANPNARGYGGRTPLQYAATAGFAESIRLLLAAGADPKVRHAKGRQVRRS